MDKTNNKALFQVVIHDGIHQARYHIKCPEDFSIYKVMECISRDINQPVPEPQWISKESWDNLEIL